MRYKKQGVSVLPLLKEKLDMSNEKKPDVRRGEIAFVFAILLGLAIGIMVRRVRIGIIIGLILGLMIVLTGWLRTTRK